MTSYDKAIREVSDKFNIPKDRVNKIYKAYWQYIRESIKELPLKETLTEEELIQCKPNFNIPSIGKLGCCWKRYQGVKQKLNYINNIRKSNEAKED